MSTLAALLATLTGLLAGLLVLLVGLLLTAAALLPTTLTALLVLTTPVGVLILRHFKLHVFDFWEPSSTPHRCRRSTAARSGDLGVATKIALFAMDSSKSRRGT